MKFKAAVLEKLNAPLAISTLEYDDDRFNDGPKLRDGDVLVRMLASGICGAQLQEIAGEKGNAGFMPHMLGHEGCGVVMETSMAVTRVKHGDKVVLHWRKGEGLESSWAGFHRDHPTLAGKKELVRGGKVTTLAQYVIVSENRVTAVPHDTPTELCALLGCGLSTALGTFENEAALRYGESVLIVGTGGLGCNLIRCACMANAGPVVAMDIHERKRKPALALGASRYINAATEDLSAAGKFDIIIETSGAAMEKTLPLLAPSGRYIVVGQPKPGATVGITNARHLFDGDGKTIRATQGGGFNPTKDIPRYVALWRAGRLDVSGIITTRLPLRRVNQGIELVRAGKAGRVLIDFNL